VNDRTGKNVRLGRVLGVAGSQANVALEFEATDPGRTRIGAMVKILGDGRDVVGTVGSLHTGESGGAHALTVDLLGELVPSANGTTFQRGVTQHPAAGAAVVAPDAADLEIAYGIGKADVLRVGTLYDDEGRPAGVSAQELLSKHFAVIGTTGSGKSSAVTLILTAILEDRPNAHVVLLDLHNEYSTAFGDRAEIINTDNLDLPIWLLDYEELCRVLVRGGSSLEQESQTIILKDAVTWARRQYAGASPGSTITVDTPVPFRLFELLRFINDEMGRLGKPDTSIPYLRLRTRIESLRDDKRFAFMFPRIDEDSLAKVVGRLLRFPVSGKPISIVDLSGVPTEVADVIVALLCRIIFDFNLWSERAKTPPVLLVCEEAHRYVPSDERIGFAEAARGITRIAKEGRKYGISIALVTQRPSEIATSALSQCGTVFAMRLGSDVDQVFVTRALPEVARGMLEALPSLPTREAIVTGEAVPFPMRVRFDLLPEGRRPRSQSADFANGWQNDVTDEAFLADGIRRWRSQSRSLLP
jgi:uncharacterized protein